MGTRGLRHYWNGVLHPHRVTSVLGRRCLQPCEQMNQQGADVKRTAQKRNESVSVKTRREGSQATHKPNKERRKGKDKQYRNTPLLLTDNPDNHDHAQRKIKQGVVMVTVKSISAKVPLMEMTFIFTTQKNKAQHRQPSAFINPWWKHITYVVLGNTLSHSHIQLSVENNKCLIMYFVVTFVLPDDIGYQITLHYNVKSRLNTKAFSNQSYICFILPCICMFIL